METTYNSIWHHRRSHESHLSRSLRYHNLTTPVYLLCMSISPCPGRQKYPVCAMAILLRLSLSASNCQSTRQWKFLWTFTLYFTFCPIESAIVFEAVMIYFQLRTLLGRCY